MQFEDVMLGSYFQDDCYGVLKEEKELGIIMTVDGRK